MLPLSPPSSPRDPGYPTRDRILGDRTLRRQALGVLAAAVLSGCAGEPVPPPQPTGGTPVPSATPAPNRLPGEVSAPAPPPPPQPEPPQAEPVPVASPGLIAMPPPPEPAPLRGDVAPVQQPEPSPLRGKVASDPPPPAPVKP